MYRDHTSEWLLANSTSKNGKFSRTFGGNISLFRGGEGQGSKALTEKIDVVCQIPQVSPPCFVPQCVKFFKLSLAVA